MDLTEEQWLLIQPLLPPQPKSGGRGRPALDQRRILDGIFWKLRYRRPWRAIPSCYGSHQVCYLYYNRWQKSGLLLKIEFTLLDDLKDRGKFDADKALERRYVRFEKVGTHFVAYVPFSFSETWQASTSMIFYEVLLRSLEEDERQKVKVR
jgi:transposase